MYLYYYINSHIYCGWEHGANGGRSQLKERTGDAKPRRFAGTNALTGTS